MSKNTAQKAARRRRRIRQRQLVEAGKQAEDLVSQHQQQATEAVGRVDRLELEIVQLKHELGESTGRLAEVNKSLASNNTILDGLRAELDAAAQQLKAVETERDAMARDLTQARRELEAARTVNLDSRSLRTRLQHKTEEIEDLKTKLRESEERHRSSSGALVLDNDVKRLVRMR